MPDCDRVRSQIARYAVGGLRGRLRARVQAHLGQCPACRAELAALEQTGRLVETVGPTAAPAATWEKVKQEILARPRSRRPARVRWSWRLAMGALALLLVAVGAFFRQPHRPPPPAFVATTALDEDMQAAVETHLSAVWASPLADEAALGLGLAEPEGG